jgi:hypothetical protein
LRELGELKGRMANLTITVIKAGNVANLLNILPTALLAAEGLEISALRDAPSLSAHSRR